VRWLVVSILLSVVLTVLVNVGLHLFPGAGRRIASRLAQLTTVDDAGRHRHQTRVFVPWRAMIIGSLLLTIVINLVLWII
jgi:hypothetical protein